MLMSRGLMQKSRGLLQNSRGLLRKSRRLLRRSRGLREESVIIGEEPGVARGAEGCYRGYKCVFLVDPKKKVFGFSAINPGSLKTAGFSHNAPAPPRTTTSDSLCIGNKPRRGSTVTTPDSSAITPAQ